MALYKFTYLLTYLHVMVMFQRLQLMLETPATGRDPLSQFAESATQQPFLHELTSQRVHQPMDNLTGQYDSLGGDFMTQTTMAFDSAAADSEMAAAGSDVGMSDYGLPSLDVSMTDTLVMTEDGMAMPDLLSTLSTDIAHLLY